MVIKSEVKRYNMVLPQSLFDQLESVAAQHHMTVMDVLRSFIKLGLLAVKVEEREDAALIIREGDKERELVILM